MNKMTASYVGMGMAAAFAAGCSKKSGDAGGGSAQPAAFAAWMPAKATEAWQGAWASRITLQASDRGHTSMAGDPIALEIAGSKVKAFDGKQEHAISFTVDAPCSVRFSEPLTEGSMKGGTAFHDMLFLLDGDNVLIEQGAVGLRKGKAAIVCTSMSGVYILDDQGTCTSWDARFGTYESKPASCTWSTKFGKDMLTIEGARPGTLIADGDVLKTEDFGQYVEFHQRAASYDVAKQTVIAQYKADDAGEQAKAAGGKVGETNTVASLQATYGADKSWKGKQVELAALYMNSNSSTSGDQTTYNAILVESQEHTKFSVTCHTKEAVTGLTQWDKVTAKGTVDEAFGRAELRDCTLTKAP